jgi:hypothetical protein
MSTEETLFETKDAGYDVQLRSNRKGRVTHVEIGCNLVSRKTFDRIASSKDVLKGTKDRIKASGRVVSMWTFNTYPERYVIDAIGWSRSDLDHSKSYSNSFKPEITWGEIGRIKRAIERAEAKANVR